MNGPNEGSAATGAHGREPQPPPKASAGGELAHQSGVNKRRHEESLLTAFALARTVEAVVGTPRYLTHTARSAHSAQHTQNKTHRPPHQPPGGDPISMVRNPGARTVARTGAMITEIHNLGDYLGEFW